MVNYGDGRVARLQWFEGAVVPREVNKSGAKRATSRGTKNENNIIKGLPDSRSKATRLSQGLSGI